MQTPTKRHLVDGDSNAQGWWMRIVWANQWIGSVPVVSGGGGCGGGCGGWWACWRETERASRASGCGWRSQEPPRQLVEVD